MSRHGTHGSFTLVRALTADSFGGVQASVTPKQNTTYEWTYAGTARYLATTSKAETFFVRPVIHSSITRTHVKVGQSTVVYGTVTPGMRGRVVHLLAPASAGGVLNKDVRGSKTRITRQRMPNGKVEVGFILTFVPGSQGYRDEQNIGVSLAATAKYAAGFSKTYRVMIS